MTAGGARPGCQAAADFFCTAGRLSIKDRREQMRQRIGWDPAHCIFFGDQFFVHHIDGDTHSGVTSAFPVAGLQNVQPVVLDRELEVLHVLEVRLQSLADVFQLGEGPWLLLFEQCNRLRRAHSGHNVFALRVHQEFAVENFFAAGRVAREGDAGRAGLAHVAEDHRLHVDRRSPLARNPILAAVNDRAVVHP